MRAPRQHTIRAQYESRPSPTRRQTTCRFFGANTRKAVAEYQKAVLKRVDNSGDAVPDDAVDKEGEYGMRTYRALCVDVEARRQTESATAAAAAAAAEHGGYFVVNYPPGAVVRDGVEIDSSEVVGVLGMGAVVRVSERRITADNVVRYHVSHNEIEGWVSERLRGGDEALVIVPVSDESASAKEARSPPSPTKAEVDALAERANEAGLIPYTITLETDELEESTLPPFADVVWQYMNGYDYLAVRVLLPSLASSSLTLFLCTVLVCHWCCRRACASWQPLECSSICVRMSR